MFDRERLVTGNQIVKCRPKHRAARMARRVAMCGVPLRDPLRDALAVPLMSTRAAA
jgi:hypothetical protein